MLLHRRDLTAREFEQITGWEIKAEGACKDAECVPLPPLRPDADGRFDVVPVAEQLGMPVAYDGGHGLWALGPRSGDGRVLHSARVPDLVLRDFDGEAFDLADLRGRKVVLVAWASW